MSEGTGPVGEPGNASVMAAFACGLGIAAVSFYAFAPPTALVSCLLGWTMLAIAAIDAERLMIPDILSLPAIPLGLLASGWLIDPRAAGLVDLDHVAGALLGGAGFWLVREAYWRYRGREGLGLGDVKLAAAGGAWTGWEHLAHSVLMAAMAALGLIIMRAAMGRGSLSAAEKIPFGAFLAPSIWAVWCLHAYTLGL